MLCSCQQCGGPAEMHITWLAKKSENENETQQCNICNECMSVLWTKYSSTQFGQTIQIEPAY